MNQLNFNLGTAIWEAGPNLDLSALMDMGWFIIDYPTIVTFVSTIGRIELPPSKFICIAQAAGRITQVEVSPQLEPLNLERAINLAQQLIQNFERAGWENEVLFKTDAGQMKSELSLKRLDHGYKKQFGEWRARKTTMRLSMRELNNAPIEITKEPDFVVNCDFFNNTMRQQAIKVVIDKRIENGDAHKALPLSAWR